MAQAKQKSVASQSFVPPSRVEHVTVKTVTAVVSGDCAFVRGVLAGWELSDHAAEKRDARVAELVAYYKSL